ncbi:macrolide ABC transporter ATP-binding protein [Ktedonobacter sp. SOSP1-52]|uniref:ABC transporter ATP-binding protein n=1 Tax=Ktedonobacter sp. SOSP1-52 TaxID=2778366 RepID=UPI001914DD4B|nr:ABC transporter ATP-binding protein [Ktedonobacter sp. SOSP1-52]GHO67361.1 macrolide ABC transporter ATP-binding protein [Ktedonobacter sp. SOSP1-52]
MGEETIVDAATPAVLEQDSTVQKEPTVTIVAEKLSKHFKMYGEVIKAVDEASFVFTEGQFVTIMGPSGSGKSTLLYILGSLDKPTGGELVVDGINVMSLTGPKEHKFRRQNVGFVFQSFHLIPNLTALENVMLPMELAGGKSRADMRERARTLLLQVGIDENRHRHRPGRLSGGQKQRVAIARALANDPKVILADEPTGNLDSQNGKRIIDLLKRLANQGRTVIVVSHDRSVAKVADVRIEIEDGKIEDISGVVVPAPQPTLKKKRRR